MYDCLVVINLDTSIGYQLWKGFPNLKREYTGEALSVEATLLSENANLARVVGYHQIDDTLPNTSWVQVMGDQVAPLRASMVLGTILPPSFPNLDSHVSGDFTMIPYWLRY